MASSRLAHIADEMQAWLEGEGSDGFNVLFPDVPGGALDLVEKLVPELQRRAIFRREYGRHHPARTSGSRAQKTASSRASDEELPTPALTLGSLAQRPPPPRHPSSRALLGPILPSEAQSTRLTPLAVNERALRAAAGGALRAP
jgi:hypothetical protein